MDQKSLTSVKCGHAVTFERSTRLIHARPELSVLTQAEEQGMALPSGCRSGGCGACKAKVLSGSYLLGPDAIALTQAERDEGFVLLCQTFAKGPLNLSAPDQEREPRWTARIASIDYPEETVATLRLEVEGDEFPYKAGQHLDLVLKDGTKRTYSIANRFEGPPELELHIRLVEGGRFTSRLRGTTPSIRAGMRIRLSSARGEFFLRPTARKIVFVATGTGYAPVRAMLHELRRTKDCPDVYLYWGARTRRELYAHEEALRLVSDLGGTYVTVLSDPHEAAAHSARAGFVHMAVMNDFPSLQDCDAYVCGAPSMVRAASTDFVTKAGLPPNAFFADPFTPSL